jgi:uncharacterized protein (UPF0548 family)
LKFVRPSNVRSIDALLQSLSNLEPNYSEVGASLTGATVSGFRNHHYQIDLSAKDGVFDRAVLGLKTWQAHDIPRLKVYPETQRVALGKSVILELGPRIVAIAAPCRIVRVVEQPDEWGFAYGTLPGHPECGEESFVVRRSTTGWITFEISGFSRAASSVAKFSGPVARKIQTSATNSYLRALKRYAEV